jgi:hypothetical protein
MEKILLAFFAKTLNKSTEEVATLIQNDDKEQSIKDDALDQLLKLDAARVTELKSKGGSSKEDFDNGYKKATGEVLTKRDKEIKEHYGITTDLKGLDLVSEVLATKTKALENKEITSDDVKKSPTYQTAIQNLNTQNELKITELTKTHGDVVKGYERKESLVSVIQAADQLIDTKINPIWSKEPSRALNQRKFIHEKISSGNFKENPNGLPIVLDSEGKALEDAHGNPVPFEAFVTDKVTSILDVQKGKPRESAGDAPDDDGAGGGEDFNWNRQKPANDEEFMKLTREAKSSEEKLAILKSYKEEA